MTVRIVDRRFDSKNKSSVNRSRFIRRFKGQIRKAVSESINKRHVRDLDNGEKVSIPGGDIAEPQFVFGNGGVKETVHPGNDRFASGDEVKRPEGGGGGQGGGEASNEGEGLDNFVFTLTREEFLDIFFDELALPHMVKRQLAKIEEYKNIRAGYSSTGVPTNINLERTMRGAAGRRIALSAPYRGKLRRLTEELEALEADPAPDDAALARMKELRLEIARLRTRIEALPFIDPFDLRFNNRIRIPQPSTRAVMFCLLDVSASMDEERKNIAKRFFMLLYLFLQRNYEHIEIVFIRHHATAEEVDEEEFFSSRKTGGTVVSSALKLMQEIIEARYQSATWNVYGAQASDGDNWYNDSSICHDIMESSLLPLCQYFAYIEINGGIQQNLWDEYEKVQTMHPGHFAMQKIAQASDIYPVFRELFKRPA